jgi:hypothetical protein
VITWGLMGTARAEWREVLWGSVGTGVKEDESSTGSVCAAVFHHVTARSRLARVWKLMNRLFPLFLIFLGGRGRGKPLITETANTEPLYSIMITFFV